MAELTNLLSAVALCLFGVAAILAARFALKMVPRFDRVLTLIEKGALSRLPTRLVKLIGKS
jgi:hypothetical protein